jgi:hypothetical protein
VTHNKYRSNKNTYHEIRNVSDRLCKEYELPVIEPQAKTYGKSYDRYRPDQTSGSWRQKLQSAIDSLIPQAKDFEDLLKQMEAQGYRIKRGKYISFKVLKSWYSALTTTRRGGKRPALYRRNTPTKATMYGLCRLWGRITTWNC